MFYCVRCVLSEWGYTPNVPHRTSSQGKWPTWEGGVESPKNQKTARQEKEVAKNGNGQQHSSCKLA